MSQLNWLKSNCMTATVSMPEILKNLQAVVTHLNVQPASLAGEILEQLCHPKSSKLLERILVADNDEFVCGVLQCLDDAVKFLDEKDVTATQIESLEALAKTLFQLHFETRKQFGPSKNQTLLLTTSLSLLNKITTQCPNFAQTHISELLGVAKAFVNYGLENSDRVMPQKVLPAQNHLYDCSADEQDDRESDGKSRRNGGGKTPKKRKPRALAKSLQNTQQQQTQQQQLHFQTLTLDHIVKDIKTSDSDASELENNVGHNGLPRVNSTHERMKCAKLRLSAISLIGAIVTRLQERRYGYWHAFFENTKIENNELQRHQRRTDLLHIGLHDPNSRCRLTALQIAGQLIFSSKNFLQQAEYITKQIPMAFLPFAHSLGLQVVSMFEELTQILKAESSLPVLTQGLKCLAVLVQATSPFQKFQPRDFIADFVKELQRLVLHRDATIKVAALMVLEFLIAAPELTTEISSAIGATYHNHCCYIKEDQANDIDDDSNIFDEYIASDSEAGETIDEIQIDSQMQQSKSASLSGPEQQTCWLLQCVLHNLGVYPNTNPSTTTVRIECLQVLASMAQHFSMLETHLDELAIGIEMAILETQNDLRICAARCLDTLAYQIGRKLLENGKKQNGKECNQLERECLDFWNKILPTIMAQIRSSSSDLTPSIKVCLCDAISNIGVIIFEQQSHAAQMNLIGFLCGVASDSSDEDATVRSACVRALAVYVLFPSLRGNLVFIENTAELTLRLIGDANMMVRVKASWALGNITDALLTNDNNDDIFEPERISVDLFWRLITAATEACNDNDKVRCNAVRTLGNLLRILQPVHCNVQSNSNIDKRIIFRNALAKIIDCLRSAGSAKVKWNTCYAIGNFLQNTSLFHIYQGNNFDWQSQLYSTLANVIVNHPNFKVRINAATALTRIATRTHFGAHYEMLWKALVSAIEQSHHLDNFYEYNHRDHLQEQLCLAMSHMIHIAQPEDFLILNGHLKNSEISSNTWTRVFNRMVPEKSAPIVACTASLQQQLKDSNANLTLEQCKAISSIFGLLKLQ